MRSLTPTSTYLVPNQNNKNKGIPLEVKDGKEGMDNRKKVISKIVDKPFAERSDRVTYIVKGNVSKGTFGKIEDSCESQKQFK